MKTRLIIIQFYYFATVWKERLQRLSSILDKENEQTVTASTTTKREHLNKWLWKIAISYSQNVIWYITRLICWWPWKFNHLPNHWMNYAASDRCRTKCIGQIHCWHKQTVTLASMELSSFVPAVSLACHPCSADPESFEVNGRGPWLQGTLDHVWCTTRFASNWISYTADHHVHTYLVSWHVLTQEWDWKCIPSSKYSISVTQARIWSWSLHI